MFELITRQPVALRLVALLAGVLLLSACNDDRSTEPANDSAQIAQASGINAAPILQGSPAGSVKAGERYVFAPVGSDPDGDPLTFFVTRLPAWAAFDSDTGRLEGTPQESDVGEHTGITISVSDGQAESIIGPFTITVEAATSAPPPPTNASPLISGTPSTSVVAGSAYSFTPTASDPDGDALTFAIQNRPAWAVFDPTTGQLSGTPSDADAGAYSGITVSVSDGQSEAALEPFSIVVEPQGGGTPPPPVNTAPTISGTPPGSVVAGDSYAFVPGARDADGDALTFSIRNKPAWASFSSSSGRLSGRPGSTAIGTYSGIEITVSDGTDTATLPTFSIAVLEPPNSAPVISGSPSRTVTAGTSYGFTPTASDADGDSLTFSIQNAPSWTNFSTSTGRLSGVPTVSDVGTYGSIVITVSDGQASTSLGAFSITVEQVSNGSVTLSWTAPTQNTDGTVLTDLAGYRIIYGTNSSNLDQQVQLMNPGLTTAVVENLAAGTWYFAVKALNAASVESDLSNVASKTIP
ncbi:MAG TPA: putative Ig domain-containing protein [Steroidobacteraceae bacterium]|nr:putative Ig domain-containing protein [Steroidobacteraceae bacterium]